MPKEGDIVYFIFPYSNWFNSEKLVIETNINCKLKCCWVVGLDEYYVSLLPFNTYRAKNSNKTKKRSQKIVHTEIGFTQEHKFVITNPSMFKDDPRPTKLNLTNLLKIPCSCYKKIKNQKDLKNYKEFNIFQIWYKSRIEKINYVPNVLNTTCFEKINKKCETKTT